MFTGRMRTHTRCGKCGKYMVLIHRGGDDYTLQCDCGQFECKLIVMRRYNEED